MKLTPKIIAYLRGLEKRPAFLPSRDPAYFQDLWLEDYVSIVGKSVYITDKGREALANTAPVDKPCGDRG